MVKTPIEIQEHLDNLSEQIKDLEKLKIKSETIYFKKSRICCPDVCKTIDNAINNLNIELEKAEKEKKKIIKLVGFASSIFQSEESGRTSLEHQAIKKSDRIKLLINEQITSLKSLKETLSAENVCKCKK